MAIIGAAAIAAGISAIGGAIAAASTAAIIAGVVSTFVVTLGTALISKAIAGNRDIQDGYSSEQSGNQTIVRSPVASARVIYGEAVVSGVLVYAGVTGDDNEFLHFVLVLAAHEVESIGTVYFNQKPEDHEDFAQKDRFDAPAIRIYRHLGNEDQPVAEKLFREFGDWTEAHRIRGHAYIHVIIGGDHEDFAQVPNITAQIRGRKVVDTRIEDYDKKTVFRFLSVGTGISTSPVNINGFIYQAELRNIIPGAAPEMFLLGAFNEFPGSPYSSQIAYNFETQILRVRFESGYEMSVEIEIDYSRTKFIIQYFAFTMIFTIGDIVILRAVPAGETLAAYEMSQVGTGYPTVAGFDLVNMKLFHRNQQLPLWEAVRFGDTVSEEGTFPNYGTDGGVFNTVQGVTCPITRTFYKGGVFFYQFDPFDFLISGSPGFIPTTITLFLTDPLNDGVANAFGVWDSLSFKVIINNSDETEDKSFLFRLTDDPSITTFALVEIVGDTLTISEGLTEPASIPIGRSKDGVLSVEFANKYDGTATLNVFYDCELVYAGKIDAQTVGFYIFSRDPELNGMVYYIDEIFIIGEGLPYDCVDYNPDSESSCSLDTVELQSEQNSCELGKKYYEGGTTEHNFNPIDFFLVNDAVVAPLEIRMNMVGGEYGQCLHSIGAWDTYKAVILFSNDTTGDGSISFGFSASGDPRGFVQLKGDTIEISACTEPDASINVGRASDRKLVIEFTRIDPIHAYLLVTLDNVEIHTNVIVTTDILFAAYSRGLGEIVTMPFIISNIFMVGDTLPYDCKGSGYFQQIPALNIEDYHRVWTKNAALNIFDYMTWNEYGHGIDYSDMDIDGFELAAGLSGSSMPDTQDPCPRVRYTLDGVVNTANAVGNNLSRLTSSCGGVVTWSHGLFNLHVAAPKAPVMTITSDMIQGSIDMQCVQSKASAFNSVKALYVAGDQNWQAAETPIYKDLEAIEEDAGETLQELDLPYTDSTFTAQRLAVTFLNLARLDGGVALRTTYDTSYLKAMDVVYLNIPEMGIDNEEYQIGFHLITPPNAGDPGGVSLVLNEYDAAAYDVSVDAVLPPDETPTLPPVDDSISPPTNFLGTSNGTTRDPNTGSARVVLTWTPTPNIRCERYDITATIVSGGSGSYTIRVSGRTTETITDPTPENEQVVEYQIVAVRGDGLRSSVALSVHVVSDGTGAPSMPQNFIIEEITGNAGFANWTYEPDPSRQVYELRIGESWRDSEFIGVTEYPRIPAPVTGAGLTHFLSARGFEGLYGIAAQYNAIPAPDWFDPDYVWGEFRFSDTFNFSSLIAAVVHPSGKILSASEKVASAQGWETFDIFIEDAEESELYGQEFPISDGQTFSGYIHNFTTLPPEGYPLDLDQPARAVQMYRIKNGGVWSAGIEITPPGVEYTAVAGDEGIALGTKFPQGNQQMGIDMIITAGGDYPQS